jgi:hypothetical protein
LYFFSPTHPPPSRLLFPAPSSLSLSRSFFFLLSSSCPHINILHWDLLETVSAGGCFASCTLHPVRLIFVRRCCYPLLPPSSDLAPPPPSASVPARATVQWRHRRHAGTRYGITLWRECPRKPRGNQHGCTGGSEEGIDSVQEAAEVAEQGGFVRRCASRTSSSTAPSAASRMVH